MDDESWEPTGMVEYRDHHQVSDLGRVRRFAPGPSTRPGKVLTPTLARGSHPVVRLSAGGIARNFALAPIVAAAFLPPRPAGAILKHRDGDPSNCAAGNLCWTTRSDPETRGHRRKLSAEREAEVLGMRGVTPGRAVAQRYGVSESTVREIWKGRRPRRRPGR